MHFANRSRARLPESETPFLMHGLGRCYVSATALGRGLLRWFEVAVTTVIAV
jgi:hypothetical protein